MDYFTVKQQYYTGNYKQSLQEIAKHNKIQDDTLFLSLIHILVWAFILIIAVYSAY